MAKGLNESDRHPVGSPQYRIGNDLARLSASRPARASFETVRRDVQPHDHSYTELCFVVEGEAIHRDTSGGRRLVAGDVVTVPPGQTHAFERPRGLVVCNVYHLSEWLLSDLRLLWQTPPLGELVELPGSPRSQPVRRWSLSKKTARRVQRELDELVQHSNGERPSSLLLRAMLLKALSLMAGEFEAETVDALPPEVQATLDAIERCVAGGTALSIADVAAAQHCSSDWLTRQFRGTLGQPPMTYFQSRRTQAVAAALLESERSITSIAYATGYADAAHLVRHFRRHFGMTPSDYRARYCND